MTVEERIKKTVSVLGDTVTGSADILGNQKPSALFYPMVKLLQGLLKDDTKNRPRRMGMMLRRLIHPIIKLLLPAFLDYKQKLENNDKQTGDKILNKIPKEPVIWCANHGFKDDIAASMNVTRHSYMFFASLPHFYNTFDGFTLFLNGVILCNRKVRASKKNAYELALNTIRKGNDITIYPEGVWNKTPDKLMLDFWPGIYRLAKETNCKIVPIIHYLPEPHKNYEGNVIHTVIAEPICPNDLSEAENLTLLRDTMATQYYYLMEKYGRSTREEVLAGFDTADEAWENYIEMHTGCAKYYDKEIELYADYRAKQIVRPEDVWQNVSNIQNVNAKNIKHIKYAQELVAREKRRDFQRRF